MTGKNRGWGNLRGLGLNLPESPPHFFENEELKVQHLSANLANHPKAPLISLMGKNSFDNGATNSKGRRRSRRGRAWEQ